MTMGELIRMHRLRLGMTQEELGKALVPPVQKSAINKWEHGAVENVKRNHIQQLAKLFDMNPVDLMCFDYPVSGAFPLNDSFRIPLLGRVAAGEPLFDEGNVIGEVYVDPKLAAGGADLFALTVRGDSMYPYIRDGDEIICRAQPDVDDGEIAIVTVNGDEGTVKKIKHYPDSFALLPLNPAYEPIIYTAKEVQELPVRIVAKVLQTRHNL